MPKQSIDYSKCIIYKFTCLDKTIEYIYVGSTTNWIQRKRQHKSDCNNEKSKSYNYKLYTIIRENGGWDNWNMIQIEEYPCNNKREAVSREEYWRVELNAQLNMRCAFRTKEERNEQQKQYIKNLSQEKKEQMKERDKKYREENKEEIKTNKKKYYEEHKEDLKESNRQRAKKYYEEHKEEVLKKQKEYQKKKISPHNQRTHLNNLH
jgi:hypothetical protein